MLNVLIGTLEYEVDEYGQILKRRGKGFLTIFPDKDGYLKVSVTDKHKVTHNESLHRVVYRAFNGEIPDGMTVDHIDKDKLNNHKDNLQLMTAGDNSVKGNAQVWLVVSPSGDELVVENLAAFCRENGLHKSHIRTHRSKGYKAYEL